MGGRRRARTELLDGCERNDRQKASQDERQGRDNAHEPAVACGILIRQMRNVRHAPSPLFLGQSDAWPVDEFGGSPSLHGSNIGSENRHSMNETESVQCFSIVTH